MKINPDRVDLIKEIPLSAPLIVIMESTSKCNFACTFCPTSRIEDVKRVGLVKQHMPDFIFRMVMDDLSRFPQKIKQLHFHYDGEPLLQPNLLEWIDFASHTKKVAIDYAIRTNGLLLTPDIVSGLAESGLTMLGISIEAVNEAGYRRLTHTNGSFNIVMENMQELSKSKGNMFTYAKIIDFGLPETDPATFTELFAPFVDVATIEYPMQWNNKVGDTTNNIGTQVSVNGDANTEHIVCPYPFFSMGISSRGEVNACCFDWSWQTTFGNIRDNTLAQIWNGEARRKFLRMHLLGQRSNNPACRDCTAHKACPDNLDRVRYKLLEKFK